MANYTIELDLRQSVRDLNYRAVLTVLGKRGYPTSVELGEDGDLSYRPGRELDNETIQEIEQIPGVKVKQW
ncbi:MAG: hypothetical protein HYW27_02655 [Candidatus Aenigmarchaeota archaeon]|nr:hypothetical protein [Candidatus Aenigmarchaeota archaeon]